MNPGASSSLRRACGHLPTPAKTAYWSAFLSLLPLSVVRPVFLYLPPSMFTCKPLMMENLMHGALHTPTAPISRADFLRQPPWRNTPQAQSGREGRVAASVRPSHLRRGLVSLSRPTVRVRGRCSYRQQYLPAATVGESSL